MTNAEKTAYLEADKCLMSLPSKMTSFPGAKTRWDDLQYAHINMTNIIHGVGGFLPFHRYYMNIHLQMIKNECNYTGSQPYWEEEADVDDLAGSSIFDTQYGFGGDGVGTDGCVMDGPFANTTLHYGPTYEINDNCLARNLDPVSFQWANQTYLDQITAAQNYSDAWVLLSAKPHTAGHFALGGNGTVGANGTMYDQACSPGDPLFFLHHTNLDRLWWEWQAINLTSRLYDISGNNSPRASFIDTFDLGYPTAAWYDYDGDNGGNVTTLNHTLSVLELWPNATAGDVMDIQGGYLCYEYV